MLLRYNIGRLVLAMLCIAFAVSCAGAEFMVPGTSSFERLEVEEGYAAERRVAVPLIRANLDLVETNVLSVSGVEHVIIWGPGEERKIEEVGIPSGLVAGNEISLVLRGVGGEVLSESCIAVVAPMANTIENPWWIGERNEDSLGWGEWTMDIAAATGKVAAVEGKAFTIIYFSGVLWCPWCQGLENGVFRTDTFKAWCAMNRVALVVLDNPRRSASDHISGERPYTVSTVPDGRPPTLLRYESGMNNVIGRMVSGASYLSRKGIPLDIAEAKLQENHTLGYRGGAFAAPESWRTGYPTLILLKKDGTIAGRLNYYAPTTTGFDTDENMARLDDLIRLADGDGEDDNYASTTTKSIKCGERVNGCRFQINDRTEVFSIEGIQDGPVEFRVTNKTEERPVVLSVLRVSGDIQNVIAKGTDVVSCNLSGEETGRLFLKALAFGETAMYGVDTTFSADIESKVIAGQSAESECSTVLYVGFNCQIPLSLNMCNIPSSGKVRMKVLSGKMPPGIKFAYSAETGSAMFSGIAKKAGEYHAVCRFNDGEVAEFSFTVKDPTVENPNLSKIWSTTLPLLHHTAGGIKAMGGSITLSAHANNTLFAKYVCAASGKTVFFKGRWDAVSRGTVTTELTAKSGVRLSLALAVDGTIKAIVDDSRSESILESGVCTVNTDNIKTSFSGIYTVALPKTADATGVGYLTLSISEGTGKVKWRGILANGRTVSGVSTLTTDTVGLGLATVFKVTSKYSLAALLAIRPRAGESMSRRAVRLAEDTEAIWSADGISYKCKAYGSWYADSDSLAGLCLESALPTTLQFQLGIYSNAVTVTESGFDLSMKNSGLRLSFRKKDGVFKGAGKIEIGDRTVTVKYAGVIIPGWYDCGCELADPDDMFPIEWSLPFAIGSACYTEMVNGIRSRRSLAVKIGVVE